MAQGEKRQAEPVFYRGHYVSSIDERDAARFSEVILTHLREEQNNAVN